LRFGIGDERADVAALQHAVEVSRPRRGLDGGGCHALTGLGGNSRLRLSQGERSGHQGGEQQHNDDGRKNRRAEANDKKTRCKKSAARAGHRIPLAGPIIRILSDVSARHWLLFKYQRWSADALAFQVDVHLDAIGDLNEGNAAVHSVILAVEGHSSCDFAFTCSLT
jgi:hypothetical protein